jgi:hypothetical protein
MIPSHPSHTVRETIETFVQRSVYRQPWAPTIPSKLGTANLQRSVYSQSTSYSLDAGHISTRCVSDGSIWRRQER